MKKIILITAIFILDRVSKMYFLINYDLGKTIVPIFRSSALDIDFYSSTQIFHNANNLKKLVDFENTYIPLSKKIIENISNKKKIDSIENEFEKLLITNSSLTPDFVEGVSSFLDKRKPNFGEE